MKKENFRTEMNCLKRSEKGDDREQNAKELIMCRLLRNQSGSEIREYPIHSEMKLKWSRKIFEPQKKAWELIRCIELI